jgi:hypothetical protein
MVTMLGCMFVKQNNMSEKQITTVNSSILTILFVVFLVLKLTGNIDWSWWWVTSPLWLPLVLTFLILSIIFVASIIILFGKGNK